MPIPRLHLAETALLVVDMQEKLLPAMHDPQGVTSQVGRLIDGFNALELPILVTEQYRNGLGETVPELAEKLKNAVCCEEKLKFSACIEPIRDHLTRLQVRSVVVCGIEAHVCVLQTCLELMNGGYVTAVAADAVSSRREFDQTTAISRLTQAGVIPTTVESVLLELVHEAGTEAFGAVLPIIK